RAIYAPVQEADFTIARHSIQHGDMLEVCLRVSLEHPIQNAVVSFVIQNESDTQVLCWHTSQFDAEFNFPKGTSELRFAVGHLYLHPGRYRCSMDMTQPKSIEHCIWYQNQQTFELEGHRQPVCGIPFLVPYRGHSLKTVSAGASSVQALNR